MNFEEQQYLELLRELVVKAESEGFRDVRDGHKRCSLFGRQLRFDLSKSFPLMTHKKVFFKSIFTEVMWFLTGSNNERDLCELNKGTRDQTVSTIWTQNTLDGLAKNSNRFNGHNMGAMYNQAWRKQPCSPHGITYVKKRKYVDDHTEVFEKPLLTKEFKVKKTYKSNNCGNVTILGKQEDSYVVQFEYTGSYKIVSRATKSIKDDFQPSVCGVGYNTRGASLNATSRALYRVWQDMLIRCYRGRSNHSSYSEIKVCNRWLNFQNFLYDAYFLFGFQEFVDSGYALQLDKDYLGGDVYSPETCVFISPKLNKTLIGGSSGNKFVMYEFDGGFYTSKTDLAKAKGVSRRSVNLLNGVTIHEESDDELPRPKIWIDQIENMLNLIKSDPTSSRMVMDSWNARSDNGVLAICHPMVQFFVEDGKLSCQLYQRSSDYIVGGSFNIAGYALLTHLIAQQCNLDVGEFIWSLGDVHLYSDQLEMAKEILTRPVYDFPQIKINKAKDLYSYEWSDVEIVNYKCGDKIKIPVAK